MPRTIPLVTTGLLGTVVLILGTCYRFWHSCEIPQHRIEPSKSTSRDSDSPKKVTVHLRREPSQPERWQAIVTADQINGWLAAEFDNPSTAMWPEGVSVPRVAIREGVAEIKWLYESFDIATTFSLRAQILLADEPNVIAVRFRGAQAGSIPVPVHHALCYATHYGRKYQLPLQWEELDGEWIAFIRVPPETAAPGQRVWIETLELTDGQVRLSGHIEDSVSDKLSLSHPRRTRGRIAFTLPVL